MSIYPITATRLKTFVLLGHSNGDGWASSFALYERFTNLFPKHVEHHTESTENYFKNIYVATSAQPWAEAAGTPVPSDVGDVEWLELTTNYPNSPAAPHPHPSPFVFPNNRGSCYPQWFYAFRIGSLTDVNGAVVLGTLVGCEVPLSYRWLHYWQEQVGIVKLAMSASLFLRYERGGPAIYLNPNSVTPADPQWQRGSVDNINQGYDFIGWWTPSDQFDFAPATDRLYKKWYDKMVGAQAALPAGCKMDVRLVVPWFGDNDSETQLRAALELSFEEGCRKFIDRIRNDLVRNDWTTLAKEEIPIVWPAIHPGYEGPDDSPGFSSVDFCNEAIQRIAADDPYVKWVDSSEWSVLDDDGVLVAGQPGSDNHYGATGYFQAGDAIYEAFLETQEEALDTLADEDQVTVSDVKERIRTYYNRSRVATDIDDSTVLIHINASLNAILNDIGDNNYWMRKRNQLSLSTGIGNVTTMPKYVWRVLKVENPSDPREGLRFVQIGFGDGGKLQIQLEEAGTAPSNSESIASYVVHYISRPRDMTRDDQLVPLPRTIVDWLVTEVCRRLARSSSNVPLQASMEGESRELRDRCLKELQVQQRAKKDRLHTVRKFPTLRYKRG